MGQVGLALPGDGGEVATEGGGGLGQALLELFKRCRFLRLIGGRGGGGGSGLGVARAIMPRQSRRPVRCRSAGLRTPAALPARPTSWTSMTTRLVFLLLP